MKERNNLYPIFLKTSQLNVLIVGGGNVALEKLSFLLKSSPDANVTVASREFLPQIIELAMQHSVLLLKGNYNAQKINNRQLVIAATNDHEVNKRIYHDAKNQNVLVNVADTPDYCDFYLGGIVTKGNVKVAISTNGKSPTTAKRLRQFFEEVIPEDINSLVQNLNKYRRNLKGDFDYKVKEMNRLTVSLIKKPKTVKTQTQWLKYEDLHKDIVW